MSETEFKEIEFKYGAENLASLSKFEAFCRARNPLKFTYASGYDHFYGYSRPSDSFARHRKGADTNQITFKRKTDDNNSYIRDEHNINLSTDTKENQVRALLKEFNLKYEFSIIKCCFVYNYGTYTAVYYNCYDLNMRFLEGFVEIEMREDYPWANKETAWQALKGLEKEFSELGITAQARIKTNLYERFKPLLEGKSVWTF